MTATYPDQRGVPVTAVGTDAVDALDRTIDAYLGFRRDAGDRLKETLAADPDMPMAHCLRGYFFHLMAVRALAERAAKSAAAARAAAEARGASRRERLHIEALEAWCRGDYRGAARRLEAILREHPRDALALRLAHYLHFYLGELAEHRDSVARVMWAWDEGVPGYGWVLGMRAFGLEEAGAYDAAERCGRRAVELDPTDTWAIHSVCHVMEMQERPREGIEWVGRHEAEWQDKVHNFANHVWWHQALYHLALDETDAVLDLYDRRFWREPSQDPLDIDNAAAMLMRLDYRGVDVGDRWEALAAVCAERTADQVLPFADAHYMMALIHGREGDADRLIANMRAHAERQDDTVAEVLRASGLALAEAIRAWGRGDWARVVDLLEPVRYRLVAIGGSHAQRDVFHQMLIQAALRAEDAPLARALLVERTAEKPLARDAWRDLARAFEIAGDPAAAERARATAAALSI